MPIGDGSSLPRGEGQGRHATELFARGERSSNPPLRVLLVEDSKSDALLLVDHLQRSGYTVAYERVDNEAAMQAALMTKPWDVIVADYTMPSFNAIEALQVLRHSGLDLPFVIVSGTIGEDVAVEAMRAGAHDYIMKGNLSRLVPAIEREMRDTAERAARQRAERALAHQALHDSLTDLPNRNLLHDRLHQALLVAHRHQRPLALMVLDLDRFKEVNDTFGHHYGDVLLQQLAQRIVDVLRDSDTVARLGGDEFALVLPDAGTADDALATAAKVHAALEKPFEVESRMLQLEASIGIALSPAHGEDAETLLRCADVAMYTAKRERAGTAIYDREQDQNSPARLALLGALRSAIDNGELELHYQVKVDWGRPGVLLAEALVRWNHPRHGLLMPDVFIPLAEQTGLIKALSRWVVDAALEQSRKWRDTNLDFGVAVNLSMQDLHDASWPGTVAALLRKHGVPPQALVLEITESSLMADPLRAAGIARQLCDAGACLSIDDFGTGYSSLAYLKRLAVHELKVDRSFVANMAYDESDAAIVQSAIELGHNLGLRVVAEGVEDAATWRRLEALGCDAAQGYYFGLPLPADRFQEMHVANAWRVGQ